jgi:hypothetical protein
MWRQEDQDIKTCSDEEILSAYFKHNILSKGWDWIKWSSHFLACMRPWVGSTALK